uniref:Microsomal triglyceride transfer protein n=1 Tax=Neogobius melanostomus TaxID=47308 RepID=A0A8C6T0R5_9GOBI
MQYPTLVQKWGDKLCGLRTSLSPLGNHFRTIILQTFLSSPVNAGGPSITLQKRTQLQPRLSLALSSLLSLSSFALGLFPPVTPRGPMMFACVVLLFCAACSISAKDVALGPRLNNNQLYKFSYTTEVRVDRARGTARGSAGYRLSSDVDINLVWRDPSNKDDQLIQLSISNVRLEHVSQSSNKKSILDGSTAESLLGKSKLAALTKPFMLHLRNGKTKAFYSYWAEPALVKNIKRGVASLLQVQPHKGKVIENDVSGRCTVEYKVAKNQVTRNKILDTCKTGEIGFTTHSKVLGVSKKASSVTVFTLEDGFIHSAVAEEAHSLAINAHRSTGAKVESRQILTLVGTEAGPLEAAGKDVTSVVKTIDAKLAAVGIIAEKVKPQCKGCPTLSEHWQSLQKLLEPDGLSKVSAPRSFLALIQSIRKASKDDILKVLKTASKTSVPQVVDAVTSSQTAASLDAMLEFLNFTDPKAFVLQERFLYACGFASHPNERMLKALLDISKGKIANNDIKESVVIIMGALVHKLCLKGGCNLPTVVEIKNMILNGPESSQEESRVQMYLLALKNSLLPEAIPIFIKYAEADLGAFNTISLTALQRYDSRLMTEEVKQTVNRIFHQNRRIYEKNVRAAAADVILNSDPSFMEVKNLLLSIGHLPHEMNKYMISKIQDILRFQMSASKTIQEAMKDMIVNNYDRFAKVGSSSSFSGFMARSADVTSTYSLDILYSGSGILRRSNMNMFGASGGAVLHGLQVAIEAQGLESLIAATPDEGEENLESFSGMSALLFDVQLRPVNFFKGYSDLMSKMFSLSGDPLNVVKGLILLTDHSEVIQLQSGLKASAEFQGGLSIDISGGMEVSLWYRESKTSVNNRGAFVVTGNVTVDMDFLKTGVEVSFDTEASLDFVTTVQFSEYPFLICIQMDKATFPISEHVAKYDSLPSGEHATSQRSKKQLVPGSEFPLHQENSNMCKKVFDSSW